MDPKTSSPPPYQQPPAPGFVASPPPQPPPPQVGQATSQPVLITTQLLVSPDPMQLNCPVCHCTVLTETTTTPGLMTYILSGVLCLLGCWLGCCLIPCCVAEAQDIEHRCPKCKHFFGKYRRIH